MSGMPWSRITHTVLAAATLVAGLAAASSVPSVQAQATGRIRGHVRFAGPPSRRPLSAMAYSRRITTPAAPQAAVLNVVVYLKDAPTGTAAPMRAVMRQEGETFVPAVLPITAGSMVDFPNEDDFFHNVFSLSHGASFDLGRFPRGQSRSRVFATPGLVKVFCHLHAHMHGVILVLDHPYFAKPSADGGFTIDDVPPGRYGLAAWHERVGEAVAPVSVRSGETARAEIALPVIIE
jgi:plastocyanin